VGILKLQPTLKPLLRIRVRWDIETIQRAIRALMDDDLLRAGPPETYTRLDRGGSIMLSKEITSGSITSLG
jgi:hypothetical protein